MSSIAVKPEIRINDFAIKLANVNGTGSSSANNLLMRAIFRMGVPVSGKNLFPSNIQGLPTWYEIRVNGDGWTARSSQFDVMVAMNGQTYRQDIAEVRADGYVIYDSTWPLEAELRRTDVTFVEVPLSAICNQEFKNPRERILMKNITTAGVLVALLDIDYDTVAALLDEQYAGKEKLRDSNHLALRLGYDYVRQNMEYPLPIRVSRMERNGDWIMTDGNTASALGCIYAGATVAAWYPITPSTSLMDAFTNFCAKYRRDAETGENRYLVLQAEDELASLAMVIGASWNGARAFTSTSGPGISLMNELLGLAYYTETPAVIFDVQRTGPSTGMPTRTQQADILEAAYASHGDTKHLVLFPGNPSECFEFAVAAFDLAERFQTPVLVLSDLDIGMNDWVVPALQWDPAYTPDRGRVLTAEQLRAGISFHRYSDADEQGVTPRTIPGHGGAYFARGSGHTALGGYTEDPAEYQEVVDRLARKHSSAAEAVPTPVVEYGKDAKVGIITLGGCDLAVREAAAMLNQKHFPVSVLRVRGFPFSAAITEFIDNHETIFVIEQNRDAQLRSLLILETPAPKEKLQSIREYGGMPISAREIVNTVVERIGR